MNIPSPLIATVSERLYDHYSHSDLNNHFMYANAPGEPPDVSKKAKITEWLVRCNNTEGVNALEVLGKFIEDYMEQEIPCLEVNVFPYEPNSWSEKWSANRELIHSALASCGFAYFRGGVIRKVGTKGPSKSLEEILMNKDIPAVDDEFQRTIANIESDPPAALTGCCAIVESLCKIYIEAHDDISMPKKQTISSLWEVVKRHLGLDPKIITDQDLLKIIQGTSSIVEGLGALRTHEGSAHGRGGARYSLHPRHVRLAVNAAHTLTTFVIETWDQRNKG